ncbi:MAG: YwiC-like family protein [Anaerolineae bacterium]|nr:YwiC-like family protein [Anaerolineae bacterium]
MNRSQVRSIAIPSQHGVWGFWLEPSLAALIAAPSWAGLCLVGAGLAALLLAHPLMIVVKDRGKGRRYPRTQMAERFALLYGSAAVSLLALAARFTEGDFWPILVVALPFAAMQLGYELRNANRDVTAELSGATAFSVLAPAAAVATGWTIPAALGLWAVMVIRVVVSILYVRARLRLEKGRPTNPQMVIAAHILGTIALGLLAWAQLIPWMAVIAGLVLLIRAILGVTSMRKPVPARVIGFREIAYGLMTAVLTGVGYRI